MIQVAVILTIVAMTYSQCPTTTTLTTTAISTSASTAENTGSNVTSTCKKVKTISRPVSAIFKQQPVYTFIVAKNVRFTKVDNICITFFPLPDDSETFKVYQSMVYLDGSTFIESFITKSYATGANHWASPGRGFVNYNMGNIGCGAYLRYSCPDYGNAVQQFILSFGPGIGPMGNGTGKLTDECFRTAQNLARENGLDLKREDYYLPPFNLPTNCVFQQICMPKDSPLSCKQGNTCKKAPSDLTEL